MNPQPSLRQTLRLFCPIFFLFITGCITKPSTISFEVKAPGVADGVFIIKGDKGDVLYGGSIKNGKLKLDLQPIEQTGYFIMNIADRAKNVRPVPFEVYLEPGTYTFETNVAKLSAYPKATSTSAIQNELTAFYTAADSIAARHIRETPEAADKIAIEEFVYKNPKSVTAAHLMLHLSYGDDPKAYYDIYKKMSEDTRNSFEGKELGDILSHLVKLAPGQPAPLIAGTTPDGQQFKLANLNKKIYLVEFWKSTNELSRLNHSKGDIQNFLGNIPKNKDLGIIGISIDSKRDWWTSAVIGDQITYPQYSDLKGEESTNAVNWGISKIPCYYLVDGNWKILEKDISLKEAVVVINQYLDHH